MKWKKYEGNRKKQTGVDTRIKQLALCFIEGSCYNYTE